MRNTQTGARSELATNREWHSKRAWYPARALSAAVVAEGRARLRDELPDVARGVQRQFEDTTGMFIPNLAVGLDVGERLEVLTSGSHDEFAYAVRVRPIDVVLRRESLVVVGVTNTHDGLTVSLDQDDDSSR